MGIRAGSLLMALVMTVLLAATFNVHAAYACSCAGPWSTEESFRKADAVFSGEVADIGRLPAQPDGSTTLRMPYLNPVNFEVGEAWKGVSRNPVVVHGQGPEASCGIDFDEGEMYLVFAYHSREAENSPLQTDFCGATEQTDVETARQMLGPPTDSLPETGGIAADHAEQGLDGKFVAASVVALSALLLVVFQLGRAYHP